MVITSKNHQEFLRILNFICLLIADKMYCSYVASYTYMNLLPCNYMSTALANSPRCKVST